MNDLSFASYFTLVSERNINLRSWYDGNQGPIANRFGVRGWPVMYVIDQDGIIRYQSRMTVELEKAKPMIQSLVTNVENGVK